MRNYLIPALLGLFLFAAATPAAAIEDWISGNRLNVPRDQWPVTDGSGEQALRAGLQGAGDRGGRRRL